MISAKPTENLAGITIDGDHDDFYEIIESIYRMTGLEESYDDYYWSVKNRLLGVCYDIRHIEAIINEEVALFFAGQKSASDVARVIQSRVEILLRPSQPDLQLT